MRTDLILYLWLLIAVSTIFAQEPALIVSTGHADVAYALAFSPDGRVLASASGDNTVKLWEVTTGYQLRTLAGHTAEVSSVIFSPDGRTIASGSDDNTIRLWNSADGHELKKLVGHSGAVIALAFSPDGRILASGGEDNQLKLWDIASGLELHTLIKDNGWVTAVAFSPDGKTLASGSGDNWNSDHSKIVRLWDVATGTELWRIATDHLGIILWVAFSSDGQALATGSEDQTIKFWDRVTKLQLRTGYVRGRPLAFSATYALAASAADGVSIWDMVTGSPLQDIGTQPDPAKAAAFSPDGEMLALAIGVPETEKHAISLWDLTRGLKLRMLAGHTNPVASVRFSPREPVLAFDVDKSVWLWDLSKGREIRMLAGHEDAVQDITFSPDGRTLASASWDGTVRIWDLDTGNELRKLVGNGTKVISLAFSPDGKLLASASEFRALEMDSDEYRKVETRNETITSTRKMLDALKQQIADKGKADQDTTQIRSQMASLESILESVQKEQLLDFTAREGELKIWNTKTAVELQTLDRGSGSNNFLCVVFAPGGKTIAAGYMDGTVRLWDAVSGAEVRALTGHNNSVYSIAFSPDGRTMASGGYDNSVRLWDVNSGRNIRDLTGHTASVNAVAFSPNGRILASGSADNTVKLWDVSTQTELATLRASTLILSLQFNQDGRLLVTGGADGSVRLWDLSKKAELGTIFNLDQNEWASLDPVGHFESSNLDQLKGLAWVFPDDPFRALPPEIFMRDYYEPRLLPRLLAGEELPKVRPLGDLNRVQPGVKVVEVKQGSRPDLAEVTVEVSSAEGHFQRESKTVSMKTGVYDLRLFRAGQLVGQEPQLSPEAEASLKNGVVLSPEELTTWQAARKVKPVAGRVELDAQTGKLTRTFTVRLPHAEAGKEIEFTAYAFNEDRVKSQTDNAKYTVPKDVGPVKRRAYVVAMGVNAYQNPDWDLRFAASDAKRIQEALSTRLDTKQYEVVPVTLVSDCKTPGCPQGHREIGEDHATKVSLHTVLELLAGHPLNEELKHSLPPGAEQIRKAEPDDLVVLSVSSHGYTSKDGMFYMIASDSGETEGVGLTAEKVKALQPKWISSDELSAWLRDVDAGEMVMVVDTCHSAATVEEPGFKPGPMGSRGLGQLAYDKGMRILAASQANDVALESEKLKQGLLTYALVHDGLEARQAVKLGTTEITLDSWLKYGSDRVPTLYEEVRQGKVQVFADAPKDVTIDEQQSNGTSTLKKAKAFQQPSLFNFQKRDFQVFLVR